MAEKERKYAFFSHRECEYFPCHKTEHPENFNCLFCYCPLYALGKKCGGNFRYTEGSVKDCSDCLFPHRRENYDAILKRYGEIVERVRAADRESPRPDAEEGKADGKGTGAPRG